MILLDTNVLSAVMNDSPAPAVTLWLDSQVPDQVWTTAVTVFELRFGLQRLPEGRKRRKLETAFSALIDEDLAGRIVPVDRAAVDAAGALAVRREAAGQAAIATRNTRHFADLDVCLENPWARA